VTAEPARRRRHPKRRGKPPGGPGAGPRPPRLTVAPDVHVEVAYRLYDERGELVDEVSPRAPLSFVCGYGQVLHGLESGLLGARLRERRRFELAPEEAFGEREDAGILEVDPDELPPTVAAGDEVLAQAPDGAEVTWRVREVRPDVILVDANHPLAGQRVRFETLVVGLRPASDLELERARAEADEQLVDDRTIVYGSEPPSQAPPGGDPSPLIQLRRAGDDVKKS
jgi:FKBP-type peptidyl-prolyl cis-trans isomerase SlyD